MSDCDIPATVAAVYGPNVPVHLDSGETATARLVNRRLRPVCGDRVRLRRGDGRLAVQAIEDRHGLLWRQDARQGRRLLAANVDLMAVVAAPRPPMSPEQVDRYLAIAALLELPALIVRNKADLADPDFDAALATFAPLGYEIVPAGTAAATDTRALAARLSGRNAVFVGLSGVGKTSLIEALVPGQELRTAALSAASGEGRHTTTATRRYLLSGGLPGGGAIVDSPGVRDIRLWPMPARELIAGFPELAARAGDCRFRDCSHDRDPGCAVRAAAEAGIVDPRRYASFRKLVKQVGINS